MKIISWNVNGLRAVYNRGFLDWLRKDKADIFCFQEIKAQSVLLPADLVNLECYHSFFNSGSKKGQAGVAIYTRERPHTVQNKIGLKRFDVEGRFLQLNYSEFILINVYLPHGGRQKENLNYKLEVYERLFKYLNRLKAQNSKLKVILIGDFNIAHTELDLARPKENQNNIMFTPEERKQIDRLVDAGFIDTFRKFNPKTKKYTWWPYFAHCRERNLGWRIDYIFISQNLISQIKKAFIDKKTFGSDHCPIGIKIDLKI